MCIGSISGDILRTTVSTQKGKRRKYTLRSQLKAWCCFCFCFFHPNFLHDLIARTVQTACGGHLVWYLPKNIVKSCWDYVDSFMYLSLLMMTWLNIKHTRKEFKISRENFAFLKKETRTKIIQGRFDYIHRPGPCQTVLDEECTFRVAVAFGFFLLISCKLKEDFLKRNKSN